MTRTTLDIDSTVLHDLKRRARSEHKTLGRLSSELLADALSKDENQPAQLLWITRSMRARIDLEDKDALYSTLDKK